MKQNIAYLSQGRLRLKLGDEPPRTVESVYGQTIRDRAVKAQQRHSWKGQSSGGFFSGAMLWGKSGEDAGAIRIAITSICRGAASGQFFYSLETDSACGLVSVEDLGRDERRMWSNNDKRLRHLSTSRTDGHLTCSVEHKMGTANIGVMLADGSGLMEATEGDSHDTAPHWVPGAGRKIVYQTAGVGRNRDGNIAGLGPYSIHLLDLDKGDVECLVEDSKHDLLAPQMTEDETLYYIQRPYRTGREVHPGRMMLDILLFPFRLIMAIFHYLNFFSMRYSGKKLTTSGGARARDLDMKQMMIWGNMINAQNEANADSEPMDLVPKSWQLMRKRSGARAEVVASGVLAFDLGEDGAIVFSNGSAIFHLDKSGHRIKIVADPMIEQLAVLDGGSDQ